VNLGAFYLFGIPLAVVLGFLLHMGGKGLWIGILGGATVQTTLLAVVTSRTNWQQQVCSSIFTILMDFTFKDCPNQDLLVSNAQVIKVHLHTQDTQFHS